MRRILILGGGTGGTLVANRLRRMLAGSEAEITVVDQDDRHVYQPGLLFVPFGLADPDEITRPRHRQLHAGVGFHQAAIERVDLGSQTVVLDDGQALGYDVLVIATGARGVLMAARPARGGPEPLGRPCLGQQDAEVGNAG